jgi:hypothetical protein
MLQKYFFRDIKNFPRHFDTPPVAETLNNDRAQKHSFSFVKLQIVCSRPSAAGIAAHGMK